MNRLEMCIIDSAIQVRPIILAVSCFGMIRTGHKPS